MDLPRPRESGITLGDVVVVVVEFSDAKEQKRMNGIGSTVISILQNLLMPKSQKGWMVTVITILHILLILQR